jgi:hypothetical protein
MTAPGVGPLTALTFRATIDDPARFGQSRLVDLTHAQDKVAFDLKEYVQQKRRPLSDAERGDYLHSTAKYRVEHLNTGLLRGKLDANLPSGIPTQWTEGPERPFETLLGEVAASVLAALAQAKARREAYQADERVRWQEAEVARKREEEDQAERARVQALCDQAPDWREAQNLRDYMAGVRAAAEVGKLDADSEELGNWSTWALRVAHDLDPLSAGAIFPDLIPD